MVANDAGPAEANRSGCIFHKRCKYVLYSFVWRRAVSLSRLQLEIPGKCFILKSWVCLHRATGWLIGSIETHSRRRRRCPLISMEWQEARLPARSASTSFFYLRYQQSWLHVTIITTLITILLIPCHFSLSCNDCTKWSCIKAAYCNRIVFKCSLLYTCSDLRTTRARLLEMFTDITCNPEIMKNATDAYFSLLQGIITLWLKCSSICEMFYFFIILTW